jgi:hypothetical protein
VNDKIEFLRGRFESDSEPVIWDLVKAFKSEFGQGISFLDMTRLRDGFRAGEFDQAASEVFGLDLDQIKGGAKASTETTGSNGEIMAKKAIVKSAAKKTAKKVAKKAAKVPAKKVAKKVAKKAAPKVAAAAAKIVEAKASEEASRGPGRPRKDGLTPGSEEAKAADAAKVTKRPRGRPRLDGLTPGSPEAKAADAAKAAKKGGKAKVRGDRRRKVPVAAGRRKADKKVVNFSGGTPNHLVIATVDGAAVDYRFKAKSDAENCIIKLINDGLPTSKIAYYAKQNFDYSVKVSL